MPASRAGWFDVCFFLLFILSTIYSAQSFVPPPQPFVAKISGLLRPLLKTTSILSAAEAGDDDGTAQGGFSWKDLDGLGSLYDRRAEGDKDGGERMPTPSGPLGLGGGIFPSDLSSSNREGITLQPVQLDPGHPEMIVGIWQVYGTTGNCEDVSCRIILRADGQVVGGPPVRLTPNVKWSDPEGLRPVGGSWEVYSQEQTGRARLAFSIIMSFQARQMLEMDGVIMLVDGFDETTGAPVREPHVFGSVFKRGGDESVKGDPGDFSMKKVTAKDSSPLVASVGSGPQRMW